MEAAVSNLRGVGPARAKLLQRLGLNTLRDLCLNLPRRLDSSGRAVSLQEARDSSGGETLVFSGVVDKRRFVRFGRRSSLRLTIADGEVELEVVFFNQPWQRERFNKGERYTFAGQVSASAKGKVVIAPQFAEGQDSLPVDRWIPVYGTTEGVGQELLRSLTRLALEAVAGDFEEFLDREQLAQIDACSLSESIETLHRPKTREDFQRARRRVLFDSLLRVQARLMQRGEVAPGSALRIPEKEKLTQAITDTLPFELTNGQRRLLDGFRADLATGSPMRRLLQGDVGSGKTVLGLCACAAIAAAGGQSAFMAPTELLAEQHYFGSRDWLTKAGLRAELLTGSLKGAARRALLERLAAGEIDVLFGTHVLFSKGVEYRNLALAVIDEQHRFGVAQRARLVDKGRDVHLLLMTATPIPRTLALTIYGDLQVSLLQEKPPGRGSITTRWLRPKDGKRLPSFLRERLDAGEQVYWVCPLIGEEDVSGAERAVQRLRESELASFGIELVHGRLASEERARRLEAFRAGEVRLLVATTVIEVGVDVPKATVIVIEEAERLGLAQLHQLRGRVGRSELDSWCLLFGKPVSRERFELLEQCDDGFELAEADLAKRGMGELAGRRQSGEFGGLWASLEGDLDLLVAARDLLAQDQELCARLARTTGEPSLTP